MKGMALRIGGGNTFIMVNRNIVRKADIKIYKTDTNVYIDGEVKPLWANISWDDDDKIRSIADDCERFELDSHDCGYENERLDFLMTYEGL